jgi:hypothetical protein
MRDGAQQSDPILQEMGLTHLEEINHLRSVSTYMGKGTRCEK